MKNKPFWHSPKEIRPVGLMAEDLSADIGTGLRLAREQSGVSLREIADRTKLPVRSLAALERNQIAQLPGGIYRRALIRAYAKEVGLDPEATLRGFLAHYPDGILAPVTAPPAAPRPGLWKTLMGFFGATVPLAAGVIYFTLSAGREASRDAGTTSIRTTADSGGEASEALIALRESPVMMMISVSSDTRLQVIADGQELVAREVAAGETIRVELRTDVVLIGDNAGAVQFSINGRAARTLGASGAPLSARIARDSYQDWLIKP